MHSVHISVACKSDIGLVRSGNEDSFVVTDFRSGTRVEDAAGVSRLDVGPKGVLLLVSDGMGGEKAGEVASALVVRGVKRAMECAPAGTPSDELLKRATSEAHDDVRVAAQDEARRGMGATLTAVHVIGNFAYVAEVGDSRAYLIRAGAIRQLTKDQSYAQLLVDAGTLRPDEVETSPMSNVLAQAMGHDSTIHPALGKLELHDRDCLLLCSDGLTKAVKDDEILETVLASGTLDRACTDLVALANRRGGVDNVTVVIAGIGGPLPKSTIGERLSRSYEILETFGTPELAPRSVGRHVEPADVKMTR
jgi:serine/threonine protein phosphatase PrpC